MPAAQRIPIHALPLLPSRLAWPELLRSSSQEQGTETGAFRGTDR
jgi:hypothetical protein